MADITIVANKKRAVRPKNGIVQPPVLPPPHRPGRNTNQLNFIFNVVNEILKQKVSEPFREPVDAKTLKLPDYHKIIKQPMDLGTIKKRLENQYYWSSQEAIEDFETVFVNCITYNQPDDQVVKMVHTLKKRFDNKIGKMPKVEVELDESLEQKTDLNNTPKQNTVSVAPFATYLEDPKGNKTAKSRKTIVATSPSPDTPKEPKMMKTIEGRVQTPAKAPAKRSRSKTVAPEPHQHVTELAGTVIDNSNKPLVHILTERRKTAVPKRSSRKITFSSAELAASLETAASSETVANTELENVEQKANAETLLTSTEIVTDLSRQQNLIQSDRLSDTENQLKLIQNQMTMMQSQLESISHSMNYKRMSDFDFAYSDGR